MAFHGIQWHSMACNCACGVVYGQLRRSKALGLSYPQCLDMEFVMAQRFMEVLTTSDVFAYR